MLTAAAARLALTSAASSFLWVYASNCSNEVIQNSDQEDSLLLHASSLMQVGMQMQAAEVTSGGDWAFFNDSQHLNTSGAQNISNIQKITSEIGSGIGFGIMQQHHSEVLLPSFHHFQTPPLARLHVEIDKPAHHEVDTAQGNAFWLAGIVLTLIGQTVMVIGLQLQKISHLTHTPFVNSRSDEPEQLTSPQAQTLFGVLENTTVLDRGDTLINDQSPYFFHWRWVVGGCVYVSGHILCWLALGMAPQSILSCLQSWNIVVTFALSPLVLGEQLPSKAWLFGSLVVLGCGIVVGFGPRPEEYKLETVDSLRSIFTDPSSVLVHATCGALFLTAACQPMQTARWIVEQSILMSAICGWYASLSSKSMSMVILTTAYAGDNQVVNWGFWSFMVCFIIFAAGNLHLLNMALKYGFMVTVIPLYEAASIIGQTFFGGTLFREFLEFQSRWHQLAFALGVVLVLFGAFSMYRVHAGEEFCSTTSASDMCNPKDESSKSPAESQLDQKH